MATKKGNPELVIKAKEYANHIRGKFRKFYEVEALGGKGIQQGSIVEV